MGTHYTTAKIVEVLNSRGIEFLTLKIYEIANLHVKSRSDTVKHANADVGLAKLDSGYIRLSLRASDHEGELVLRQLLFQSEFAYLHTKLL